MKIVRVTRQLWNQVGRDDVTNLAAALAYRFFLALIPFFIFVAALSGIAAAVFRVQDPAAQMVALLGDVPNGVADLVRAQLAAVMGQRRPGLLSAGILGALWISATGMSATINAMNRAYDVEETRSAWKRYLLATGLTLLAGTLLVTAFVLLVAGEFFGRQIAGVLGAQRAYETAVQLARWPLVVALVLLATGFLYWTMPNLELSWKRVIPGAVLYTAGWLATTYLFSLYVAAFGAYNATYGTLAGVAVLLVWFYLTGFLLLLGAELNAILQEQAAPEQVEEQRRAKRAAAQRAGHAAGDATHRAAA